MRENMFEQLDFGAFKEYIDNDDITDISYTNNGQIWVRSLEKGSYRVDNPNINNSVVEKLAFQCSNVMGTTFNNASPFLDAESPELRMNFVHESIATNGIALVIRKTPAKIRLKEENLLKEDYVTKDIHDFLIKCVLGHCNIIVCGETGSGKTEFVKYLASHTRESEKIITIEDTLELHLDRIYPHRDIVSMKTNNIASYSDVLVTCMRQNPKWILLSEVRSAEAVSAVRNSISSGHNILSTIHSDKANAVPHRMYSLMETDLDVDQFLNTIYRYVQLAVHIKAYFSPSRGKFHREIDEITEFYIDEATNQPVYNILYQKTMTGKVVKKQPSKHLMDYLLGQNIDVSDNPFDDDGDANEDGSNRELKEEFDLDKIVEENQMGKVVENGVNNQINSLGVDVNEDVGNSSENSNTVDTSSTLVEPVALNDSINGEPGISNTSYSQPIIPNIDINQNSNNSNSNIGFNSEVSASNVVGPIVPNIPIDVNQNLNSVVNEMPNINITADSSISSNNSVDSGGVSSSVIEPVVSSPGVNVNPEPPRFFSFDFANNDQTNS